eukprot:11207047-Lingulodinium_polyedra.AAC.1
MMDPTPGNVDKLCAFIHAMTDVAFSDASFQTELAHLHAGLSITHDMEEKAMEVARGHLQHTIGNKTGRFWKAMTLFPSGMAATAKAATVADDIDKEKAAYVQLCTAVSRVAALCAPTPDMFFSSDGTFVFPHAEVLMEVLQKQTQITANAT